MQMKRVLFLSAMLAFTSIIIIGQHPQDTLYLKNGSVVYGKLVEKSKERFLIKTTDGFRFGFTPDQVERYYISKNPAEDISGPKGFGFTMQSGMLIGSGEDVFFFLFSFTPMLTYTINNIHSISAGSGVELYDGVMMPLFAEYKINFSEKRLTTFYYLKGGALLNLKADEKNDYYSRDYRPGSTFGTGLGVSWPFGRYDSYIQLGYRYSFIKSIYNNQGGYPNVEKYNINLLDITFGFKF
jgi:hypothetical protein